MHDMTTALATRLRDAREACGLSLDDVSFRLRNMLPDGHWVTGPTLSRMERGRIERIDYVLVSALCEIDATLGDLAPELAAGVAQVVAAMRSPDAA